ncbi:MAG: hypothetical protein KGL39_51725 [Patescibacteria group bacterium]|nr:hypothetical protein [Patescibacteria group bacterium]
MATERRTLNSRPGLHMARFAFKDACQGKARHLTQNAARAAIRHDREHYGEERMWGVAPYRCSFCGSWHIGHSFR